jgi:hypothetical protein
MLGRRLAFREPTPEEMDAILSPGQSPEPATGEPPLEEGPGFDSAGLPSDESDRSGSAATGGAPSDTPDSEKKKRRPIFASEETKKTFRNGVFLTSVQAHRMLARTEGQIRANLYLADEEDQANIGDPLANIAARRTGISSDNPDVNDAVAGLIGFANYLVKQFSLSMIARRLDAEANPPQVIPGEVA